MLRGRDVRISQELRQDVSIFDCLAGAGAVVRCGSVGGVAEDGDSGFDKRGYVRMLEDGPLGGVGHVLVRSISINLGGALCYSIEDTADLP